MNPRASFLLGALTATAALALLGACRRRQEGYVRQCVHTGVITFHQARPLTPDAAARLKAAWARHDPAAQRVAS